MGGECGRREEAASSTHLSMSGLAAVKNDGVQCEAVTDEVSLA